MFLKQIFTVSSQKDSKSIDAPLNIPLMIVPKNNVVWLLLEKETVVEQETSKNAFKFLMQNSNKQKKLEKKSVVNSKCKLHNDVLDLCDVNFRLAEFPNAQKLMKCLVDVLWHVDRNHEHINNKFAEKQCKGLPSYFNPVFNHTYNDYKALKKGKTKAFARMVATLFR